MISMLTCMKALARGLAFALTAAACAPAAGELEEEAPRPPEVPECQGPGCVDSVQAIPQATPPERRPTGAPGAAFGPPPSPDAEPVPLGALRYRSGAPVPGSAPIPAETILGGDTGLGRGGHLSNPNTTGPGFGAIPEGGPGPGVGPSVNGRAATIQPGPVCPSTQPAAGSPCDPTANSFACTYGQTTCMCAMSWECF